MECKFVVGQKVVAIADLWTNAFEDEMPPTIAPVKGNIYTVSELVLVRGNVMVRLKEIPGHQFQWLGFRPLNERPKEADTDITVFTPLLTLKELVTEPVGDERVKV